MRILKFGGTSLDGPERVDQAVRIIQDASRDGPTTVVVSALAGVTDILTTAIHQAASGQSIDHLIDPLEGRHRDGLPSCSGRLEYERYTRHVRAAVKQLRRLFAGIRLVGECPLSTRDQILATGERLSAPLVATGLRRRGLEASTIDGSRLIATGPPGRPEIEVAETCRRVGQVLAQRPAIEIPVVTGFIGSDITGLTTTLGRGASDLSATVLAMALDAEEVEIWTDVDGVLSADPQWVPAASPLPHLTYSEATDLACFGARVLHPQTLKPLLARGIPVSIRNSQRPDAQGTRVDAFDREGPAARAITAIPDVTRFLVQAPDHGSDRAADLAAFGGLDEPPLLLSWETPGRTYSLVVRSQQSEQISSFIERQPLQVLQREDLALVAAIGGPELNLPLLRTLSEGHIQVRNLTLSGSATRIKTLLVERSMLRSTVRLLHRVLIENHPEFPSPMSHEIATSLWRLS